MTGWTPPVCTNCHKPAPLIHNIPTPTGIRPYCHACWCFGAEGHVETGRTHADAK